MSLCGFNDYMSFNCATGPPAHERCEFRSLTSPAFRLRFPARVWSSHSCPARRRVVTAKSRTPSSNSSAPPLPGGRSSGVTLSSTSARVAFFMADTTPPSSEFQSPMFVPSSIWAYSQELFLIQKRFGLAFFGPAWNGRNCRLTSRRALAASSSRCARR